MGLPLYFACLRQTEVLPQAFLQHNTPKHPSTEPSACVQAFLATPFAKGCTAFCIDTELVYEPFCADFGPLNLGKHVQVLPEAVSPPEGAGQVFVAAGKMRLKAGN